MSGHGSGDEVELLGIWFSPYVRRVVWALKMKGINYEWVELSFRDPKNRNRSLLKHNPVTKRVPVLVHRGRPVVESLVIIEYIDETWRNNPVLPSNPYERAMARFWANFVDQKITEVLIKLLSLTDKTQMEEEAKQASNALAILERELKAKGERFFGGETIGLVDIASSIITTWMEAIEEVLDVHILDPRIHPFLTRWRIDFVEFVEHNLPPKDRLLRFYRRYHQSKIAGVVSSRL
ncbi:hypothetical protein F3Y22_tig00112856pilonHSYRG00076 [Hibiscus syriacus]|uniref:glutathione transferase n=1 Tax=Hibiscus syriacus TaxID=106335 RepID=A0A6A2WSH8_HIBSY|nr:probable glutathione S-transferase [Hibiscus syriacus]KAE8664122.1 hypothetical protein F3Y22_tig00112856pilonHSYRG00076 [Hibiscus syriacus]